MILCPSCGACVERRNYRPFVDDIDSCECTRLVVVNDIWRYCLSRCTFEYVDGWGEVIVEAPFETDTRAVACEDFPSFLEEISVWTVLQS